MVELNATPLVVLARVVLSIRGTGMNLYIERIVTLKARIATLELEKEQRPRELPYQLLHGEAKEKNTILKAEVERLKKANQHWHERQPERDAQLKLQEDFEEAIDIISMTGVAPKFVEKHKQSEERG